MDFLEQALSKAYHQPEFQAWAKKAAIGARWRDAEQSKEYIEQMASRVRVLMEELGLK